MTALPKGPAGEGVAAALVDAGHVVEEATATVVRTAPRLFKNAWALQLRANLLVADSTRTRVVLTGVYEITCRGMLRQSSRAVEESRSSVSGKMWEELARVGAILQASLPTSAAPGIGER